ncbi:MAG: ribosome silencing factor [Gammaproteobacteria bacterium]|nr:ribosome silencing factor [Gammaproteobacteria bacterium]
MEPEQLKQLVLSVLDDYKALNVVEIDVRKLTSIADTMIICSGTSTRHLKTMSEQVVKRAKENGVIPLGVEGEDSAEWILVDLSDVIVHIMQPSAREFYSLEKLWTAVEEVREKHGH